MVEVSVETQEALNKFLRMAEDTKKEQANVSNSNSEILKMIAQGSIMKSNLVGSASHQAADDSKPKSRRWAGIKTGRFE